MAEMEPGADAPAATRRGARTTGRAFFRAFEARSSVRRRWRPYTSFRIGGPAEVLVEPDRCGRSCRVVAQAAQRGCRSSSWAGRISWCATAASAGSWSVSGNLKAMRQEPDHVLYAEGGVGMPTLIGYAVRRSLAGLEWGAGIPGTVAGCVVMNAGTRLGEMKDSVKAVRMIDPRGRVVDIPAADIPFSYRRAHLPRGIVAGVWLQLKPGEQQQIEKTVKEYLQYRKDTQPLTLPSAGCVFKNPPPRFGRPPGRSGGVEGRSSRRCPGLRKTCEFHGQRGPCAGRGCADPHQESTRGGQKEVRCQTGTGTQGRRAGLTKD